MRFLRFFVLSILAFVFAFPIAAQQINKQLIPVVSQRFENGEMIYRADTGDIYVLSNKSGHWWFFSSTQYGQLALNQNTNAPINRIAPIMGFGRVWANNASIRNELGWAVLPEISLEMTFTLLSTGEFYMTRLDGTSLQLFTNGTWQTISSVPQREDLEITHFDVSPNAVAIGGLINISWSAKGSDLVQISIKDTAHPNVPQDTLLDGTPEDGGNWTWLVPETIEGDIEVTLWLLNNTRFSTYTGAYEWLISETRHIAVYHNGTTQIETYAAIQNYQQGFMLWREDTGYVAVFYNDGTVTWILKNNYEGNSDNQWPTPEGCVTPVNAFGRVWGSYGDIREQIGCATSSELGFNLVITSNGDGIANFHLPDGRVIHARNFNWWE